MKCLGCDREIPWNGTGLFAYTCPCGATIFYDEKKGICPPASLVLGLYEHRELPHIDYYLGKSNFWSKEKQEMCDFLRGKGAIWSWECDQCKERVIERSKMEKQEGFYPLEFHKDLEQLVG